MVVGFCTMLTFSRASLNRMPLWLKISALSVLILSAAFTLLDNQGTLSALLPETFQKSFSKVETLDARHEIWNAAMNEFWNRDAGSIIFGPYAGYKSYIILRTGLWTEVVHNMYIQMLMNIGIVGLCVLLLMIVNGLYSAVRAVQQNRIQNAGGIPPAVALAWLVTMCIFGYSYDWTHGVAIFFALSCVPLWNAGRSQAINRPAVRYSKPLQA